MTCRGLPFAVWRLARGLIVVGALAVPALAQDPVHPSTPLIPGGDSKAPVNIDANKLEYFDREKKLVYTGDVFAQQGASTLKATKLTIFLTQPNPPDQPADAKPAPGAIGLPSASGGQDVQRMEAEGPVTVTQNDQVGIGDSAIYDKAENKVYLIGHVSLSQGPNITKGDKLTYDLTTSQAQVDGGRVQSIFTPNSTNGDSPKDKGAHPGAPAKSTTKPKAAPPRGAIAQSKDPR